MQNKLIKPMTLNKDMHNKSRKDKKEIKKVFHQVSVLSMPPVCAICGEYWASHTKAQIQNKIK